MLASEGEKLELEIPLLVRILHKIIIVRHDYGASLGFSTNILGVIEGLKFSAQLEMALDLS
jgi:hypothetical protein